MNPSNKEKDNAAARVSAEASSKGQQRSSPSTSEDPSPVASSGNPNNDADTELSTPAAGHSDQEALRLAQIATAVERDMSTKTCLSMYRFAIWCSVIVSVACIMEGYDLVLIGAFLAFPAFRRDFACPEASLIDVCEISPSWQSAVMVGPQIGQIIGVYLNGYCVEKYGFKKTFVGALVALTCFIFVTFFSNKLAIFLVGMVLCGIPWGIFQTITTNYASDVCPTAIRAYITAFTNVCWIIGQLLGAIVLRTLVEPQRKLSYKLPLGLQWAFPVIILALALLVPESPWWLIRKGRPEEARKVLQKLVNKKHAPPEYSVDAQLQMMILTNKEEQENIANSGGTGYIDCFRGASNSRRTEITAVTWMIQNLTGSALMAFSPYYFEQAGLEATKAFTFVVIQYALGLLGTGVSWILLNRMGRRPIEFYGLLSLCLLLFLIGIISVTVASPIASGYTIGSLLLVFTFVYGCTVGPVTYSIVSEVPSTRLKAKVINIARICYNLVGIFNSIITPFQLNPTAWNWGPKTAWFWAGMSFFCAIYIWFRLPELKGRTYGDIDWLFHKNVPAWKFEKTEVPLEEEYKHANGSGHGILAPPAEARMGIDGR